ncbi:hypothetical protein [Arenibacter certesii]|uniref:Uncharacterized protein n=1 Tax=Arenibacter certesii TaxID=228955 RepID=A0A918J6S5_9FLAO|nr:hypothetical protein [Arenibacter certesii]GGW50842.1 hypothetical protein GCM10007383_38190 [Arenibacter certesii]
MGKIKDFNEEDELYDEFENQSEDDFESDYDELEEKWYDIEDEYRSRYADITDGDAEVSPGEFQNTLAKIARRRGKSSIEIQNEIENW